MNYEKHYNQLIERARHRVLDGYTETHHIIPRCMGGTDRPENLVELTPEEHLVAHLLLYKFNDNELLLYAAMRMHNRVKNNKEYRYLRKQFSDMMKSKMSGENNPMYGKTHSEETKEKISVANTGRKDSEDTKLKKQQARLGKSPGNKGTKHTPAALEKIRNAALGENNPMYGKTHSEETKKKIGIKSVGRKPRLGAKLSDETKHKCSVAAKNRTPLICEYCGKSVSPSNYSRWHGNNCKDKDV